MLDAKGAINNNNKKLGGFIIEAGEDKHEVARLVSNSMTRCCSHEEWKKRLPILGWLPVYTWSTLLKDFIAGLTVGLTAIPQGIAYAVVAGLQPQYGLYSGFMGCFVYMLVGSCKDITIGPTAIMALMTQKYVESHGPDFAVLLCFLTGCIITVLGILRLGFLVEFISMPVTVGFTSAAAITIGSSQLQALFGLPGKSHGFLDAWVNFFKNIEHFRPYDTILGISTIVILVLLKKLKAHCNGWNGEGWFNVTCKYSAGLFGLARNAVVVILGTLLAYVLSTYGIEPFRLTGTVGSGLPSFTLPPFSTHEGNSTLTFMDMTRELGSAIAVVPLIAILESIAIAKAFSKGKSLDATQELVALGLCNIFGSFVSSFPTTGSFTRTAVNHASGVVTPAGGLFTGILVLMSLSFLTSTFYFIPKATLAGVIICAMFYMVEYKIVEMLWRTKKLDLLPLLSTLLACLFLGLEYGMLVGISVNILFILYNSARPRVSIEWTWVNNSEVLIVTPTQSLVFPATDYVREVIIQNCSARNTLAPVILDGTHIHFIDSTMAKGLKLLIEDLKARGQEVVFWRWQEAAKITVLGLDPALASYFKTEQTLAHLLPGSESLGPDGYEILTTVDDEPPTVPASPQT